jgi:PPOX class probable F420-dependent enzyme
VIDQTTEFGARAARHLREEIVVWMTTVSPSGTSAPRPVWYVWEEDSVLMYSEPKQRIRNIEANPRVTLNFDGDGGGGDIVVLTGEAAVDHDAPAAGDHAGYLAKYDDHIARIGMTPESFSRSYSVPIRIAITRVDGH